MSADRNGAEKKRPEQRVGPFKLVDEIRGAGSCRVFRAMYSPDSRDRTLQLTPGDHVCVKVLRDNVARDGTKSAAFSREGELLAMVDHPNVARGLTRGVSGGRMWHAVEYVEGEDLATLGLIMRQEKIRLRPELVVNVAADILAGLAAAQAMVDPRGRPLGFIHRDLSPTNVMIDVRGQAKIIDFGMALLSLREEPTRVEGTPGYMAPEQARGEQLTQGVDVYQVGLLMFELLTGDRAFPVNNAPNEAMMRIHADNLHAAWPKGVDIPIELKALVDQALRDTPEERPADAAAFYALVEGLGDDPEESRRRLGVVMRDLVSTNPDKPEPFYV